MDSADRLSNGGGQTQKEASDDQTGHCEQSHGFGTQDETGAEEAADTLLERDKTTLPQVPLTAQISSQSEE